MTHSEQWPLGKPASAFRLRYFGVAYSDIARLLYTDVPKVKQWCRAAEHTEARLHDVLPVWWLLRAVRNPHVSRQTVRRLEIIATIRNQR